jgi:hypothetical protein
MINEFQLVEQSEKSFPIVEYFNFINPCVKHNFYFRLLLTPEDNQLYGYANRHSMVMHINALRRSIERGYIKSPMTKRQFDIHRSKI